MGRADLPRPGVDGLSLAGDGQEPDPAPPQPRGRRRADGPLHGQDEDQLLLLDAGMLMAYIYSFIFIQGERRGYWLLVLEFDSW